MNKKLLLGALLVCGMGATFTSCVDDTESASVTAVRNAKAEQIKALAGLSDAQAQAALINANATKAAQEALAGLYQAQAAEAEAAAAYKNAQTDAAKAQAEEAMAKAAYEKQNYANELQKLAGRLEIEMLEQKKNLLEAQNAYDKALAEGDAAKITALQELLTTYKESSADLIEKQTKLAQDNIILAGMEAGLVSAKEGLEKLIAQANASIASSQIKIDGYNAELATYENYGSPAEAIKQLAAAEKELGIATDARNEANVAYSLAGQKYSDEQNNLDKSLYVQKVRDYWNVDANIDEWSLWSYYTKLGENDDWTEIIGMRRVVGFDEYYNSIYEYLPIFYGYNFDKEKIEYSYGENQYILTQFYDLADSYYTPVKNGYANAEKKLKEVIAANEGKKVTEAQTALKPYQDALDAANKALADAGDKATEEQKQAVKDAEDNLKNSQAAQDLDTANKNLAAANAKLANLKAYYDNAIANLEPYQGLIKTFNEASKKYGEAGVALSKAQNTYNTAESRYDALYSIVNGDDPDSTTPTQDLTEKINQLKTAIAQEEGNIKNAQANIASWEAEIAAGDKPEDIIAIDEFKSQIAQLETEIAALQKKVEMAKAQLDAAMADNAE